MQLSKSASETFKMFYQAFGKHTLGQMHIFEWHMYFRRGQMSVQDDECSEQPITNKIVENVQNCQKMLKIVNLSLMITIK